MKQGKECRIYAIIATSLLSFLENSGGRRKTLIAFPGNKDISF